MEYLPAASLALLVVVFVLSIVLVARKVLEQPEYVLVSTATLPINAAGQTVTVQVTQPANTRLTNINATIMTAGVIVSGNVGTRVGTVATEGQVSAVAATNLVSGATAAAVGVSANLTLLNTYTSVARTLYVQTVVSTATTTAFTVRFAVSYTQYA